jgi:hypothetical protein
MSAGRDVRMRAVADKRVAGPEPVMAWVLGQGQ